MQKKTYLFHFCFCFFEGFGIMLQFHVWCFNSCLGFGQVGFQIHQLLLQSCRFSTLINMTSVMKLNGAELDWYIACFQVQKISKPNCGVLNPYNKIDKKMCLVLNYGPKIMNVKKGTYVKKPLNIMMCSYFFWIIRISRVEFGKVINTNYKSKDGTHLKYRKKTCNSVLH